jgi:integrase
MRPCDIDQTRSPWTYTPSFHKTQHHGIARSIPLGPQAREIITPFLFRDPEAFLFTPAEAMADRYRKQREKLEAQGKTLADPTDRRKAKPERKVHPRYDRRTYYRAVLYGCEIAFKMPREFRSSESDRPRKTDTPAQVKAKAKVRADKAAKRCAWHAANAWHPHQVRHSAATEITKKSGKDVAQTVLGHTTTRMTDTYVEPDIERAREVMERIG